MGSVLSSVRVTVLDGQQRTVEGQDRLVTRVGDRLGRHHRRRSSGQQ
jgi:hypothetical protein